MNIRFLYNAVWVVGYRKTAANHLATLQYLKLKGSACTVNVNFRIYTHLHEHWCISGTSRDLFVFGFRVGNKRGSGAAAFGFLWTRNESAFSCGCMPGSLREVKFGMHFERTDTGLSSGFAQPKNIFCITK